MTESQRFEQWAIVDLFGHVKLAGLVTEQVVAGAGFVRIDIPATADQPAFTKLVGPSAVYGITPVTEDIAKAAATAYNERPISIYEIPELKQLRMPANRDRDPFHDHDVDDEIGDH